MRGAGPSTPTPKRQWGRRSDPTVDDSPKLAFGAQAFLAVFGGFPAAPPANAERVYSR